jgi:hypothetical protein
MEHTHMLASRAVALLSFGCPLQSLIAPRALVSPPVFLVTNSTHTQKRKEFREEKLQLRIHNTIVI